VAATVMRFPDQQVVVSGIVLWAPSSTVYFAPDSSTVALAPTVAGMSAAETEAVVVELPGGAQTTVKQGWPQGWTPDGRLIVSDDSNRLFYWTPSGRARIPDVYGEVAFGPQQGDVATLRAPTGSARASAAVRHGGRSVVVPLGFLRLIAAWSPAGVCYVATASVHDDYLLRVDLR
jgi:hypothetical protein